MRKSSGNPKLDYCYFYYFIFFILFFFLLSAVVNNILRLLMLIISNDIHEYICTYVCTCSANNEAMRACRKCERERVGSASVAAEHSSTERVSSSSISSINTFCHINLLLLLLSLLLLLLLWLVLVVIMCLPFIHSNF